ncbi:Chromate resistance protein ChrB [Actinocatenispora rupis]|uniref:ChrB N-terminal domain-containing protein n=1 Tax=Actinocatenispora rupis TaxID=519421 RepID=A0A8J3IYA8_9ACTN|nr:Chromate resistance protein ChrB [Actinocatenispora rupis]GID12281.1 hypothetical protein Aru02nite_31700 [Actinocatenispora rupis]
MGHGPGVQWVVPIVRAQPYRHRVAGWVDAPSPGPGIWAVPGVPVFADGVRRPVDLAGRAADDLLVLQATGRRPRDAGRFGALCTAARQKDWAEFDADCGTYPAESDEEIATATFTPAELAEERLRRWHRGVRAHDVFGAPGGRDAECVRRRADHGERTVAHLHAFADDEHPR